MRSYDDSPEYYRMREAREREMAENAASEEIRAIHLALAENYQAAAEEAEEAENRQRK